MRTGKLTNLQHELLKVFQYELSEHQLAEVKDLLASYFADSATTEMDKVWREQGWSEETIKKLAKTHTRTPSRK